jgi:hypothetical protein
MCATPTSLLRPRAVCSHTLRSLNLDVAKLRVRLERGFNGNGRDDVIVWSHASRDWAVNISRVAKAVSPAIRPTVQYRSVTSALGQERTFR